MVLEETLVGQLEFSSGFIFVLPGGCKPAVGAVEMWKSGALVFGRISKPGGKSGKLAWVFLSFPRFPRGVISTALFISSFSERSDADRALVAALLFSSFSGSFFVLGQNLTFPQKILHQSRRHGIAA